MKTLIFSDTHFSSRFDQSRCNYIASLINQADQVIINGDFWDMYQSSFDQFFNSSWSQLFPLLSTKQTVYLFGNHDPQSQSDERIKTFCQKTGLSHILESGNKKFFIEHGDTYVPRVDYHYPQIIQFINQHLAWLPRLALKITLIPIVQFQLQKPWHIAAQTKLRRHVQQVIKQSSLSDKMTQIECFIYGHCHLPLFMPEEKICIVGGFLSGRANYLIIEDGQMRHFQEKYD